MSSAQELDTVAELGAAATASMATTGAVTIGMNLFLQSSLNQILGQLQNLQIIVHVILINIYCVSHAEMFISYLLSIVSFEIYDPGEFLVEAFAAEEN